MDRTRPIGLVIFDCDGVLVDSEPISAQTVVVEDSPTGLAAARAAGMRCLAYASGLIPTDRLAGPATTISRDMDELAALVARLAGPPGRRAQGSGDRGPAERDGGRVGLAPGRPADPHLLAGAVAVDGRPQLAGRTDPGAADRCDRVPRLKT